METSYLGGEYANCQPYITDHKWFTCRLLLQLALFQIHFLFLKVCTPTSTLTRKFPQAAIFSTGGNCNCEINSCGFIIYLLIVCVEAVHVEVRGEVVKSVLSFLPCELWGAKLESRDSLFMGPCHQPSSPVFKVGSQSCDLD